MTSNRRKFIKDSVLASLALSMGTQIVYSRNIPLGLDLIGLEDASLNKFPGKSLENRLRSQRLIPSRN